MVVKKVPKNAKNFVCESCDYNTSRLSQYNRHVSTDKHKNIVNDSKIVVFSSKKQSYECVCGKTYKYDSGYYRHKKTCQYEHEVIEKEEKNNKDDDIAILKEMLFEMVNQNKQLQKTIQEMVPKIGNITNTINTTNKTNNIYINNLTLLNNNCKDALSMNEFIDSIQIEMKHLLHTADKGLINGITNLFLENYNKLPLQKRPLWCGDKKRKKLYIKEDEWHEDKDNEKTKEAIKSLTVKQAKNTNKYTKENPDWMEHDKKKDKFINMVKQTTSELNDDKQSNIINNLLDNIHLTDETKDKLQNYPN